MRGADVRQGSAFSYVSLEARVPKSHPLRPIRELVDTALADLSPAFEGLYSKIGRPSIPPEKLLRALLLQILYTIRSERMLMEQLDYNLLFRWFVGLGMDDLVWVPTVFTKNRDRLLEGEIAQAFFQRILDQAKRHQLLSDEHFTVDGTLIKAWANPMPEFVVFRAIALTIAFVIGSVSVRATVCDRLLQPMRTEVRIMQISPRMPRASASGLRSAWSARTPKSGRQK